MSTLTKVDIYNMALDSVGHTESLSTGNENNKAGRLCRRWYPLALDATLRDFPWQFAMRAVALAVVSGASFPGWGNVYRYPTDCLQAHQITDAEGSRQRWYGWLYSYLPGYDFIQWFPPKIAFHITSDDEGKLLLTDLNDAYLIYTARITATNVYDLTFANALAQRLAYHLAIPFALKPDAAKAQWIAYRAALSEAKTSDLNERQPDERRESPSITARY